jgi:hypothetical protein
LRSLPPREFADAYEEVLRPADHPSRFETMLLEAMAEVLARNGDEERLTKLLAARYPANVVMSPTEAMLARSGLADPVRVLVRAYESSGSPDVRDTIASSLRTAFPDIDPEQKMPPAAFVAICGQWFERHRLTLLPNPSYGRKIGAESEGLYVPK